MDQLDKHIIALVARTPETVFTNMDLGQSEHG